MIWKRLLSVSMTIIIALLTMVSPAYGASDLTWDMIRGGSGRMSVSMIDVGQGNCVVIGCPNGNKILADCGSNGYKTSEQLGFMTDVKHVHKNSVKKYVESFLDTSTTFNSVVISHGDKDHYSLIKDVIPENKLSSVNYVYIPEGELPPYKKSGTTDKTVPDPTSYGAFLGWLDEANDKGKIVKVRHKSDHRKGDNIYNDDKGYKVTVYNKIDNPSLHLNCGSASSNANGAYILVGNYGEGFDANGRSIVLFLRYGNPSQGYFTVMLPGDSEDDKTVLKKIKERYQEDPDFLKTDVMMASHHGAINGMTVNESFLKKTKPQIAVLSSYLGKHNHPTCTAVDNFMSMNSEGLLSLEENHNLAYCKKSDEPYYSSAKRRKTDAIAPDEEGCKDANYLPRYLYSRRAPFGTYLSGSIISTSSGDGKFSVYTCPFPAIEPSEDNWSTSFLNGCEKVADNKSTN